MHTRPSLPLGLLVLALLLSPLVLHAEEEQPDAAKNDPPPPPVVAAFTSWLDGKRIALKGRVTRKQAAGAMGGPGTQIMLGAGGSNDTPFEGRLEAQADAHESAVASTETLPGFAVLSRDEGVVTRLTFEDRPYDVAEVRGDMLALLDRHRLRRWIPKASWKAVGSTRWEAEVSRRLLPAPPRSNPVAPPPRNLKTVMTVDLDAQGALRGFRVRVERDDPTQAMARRLLREQGGLPGGLEMPPAAEDEDAAANVIVYDLEVTAEPPARVRKAAQALRRDLGGDDVVTPGSAGGR